MSAIIEIFPKICQLFPKFTSSVMTFGMSSVYLYHIFCGNILINTAFENGSTMEKVANEILSPIHYICEGKKVSYDIETEKYILKQRFDYRYNKKISAPVSLALFPSSALIGIPLKAATLLSKEVRERHQALKKQSLSIEVDPNTNYYQALGLAINDYKKGTILQPQGYIRRPGDENHLRPDKEALKIIVDLLYQANIPFWIDCGTLLGAYRYGGVIPWDNDLDLAVLVDDFQNVMNVLHQLDPKKFVVQDWSNRTREHTYLRVYIRENKNHIDIYHNRIDPTTRTIATILSHEESNFMSKKWIEREKCYTVPRSYETIFPLKRALFDGIEVPIPNQTEAYLQLQYGADISPVKIYSEETGQYEKDLSHPFWKSLLGSANK